jgi:hypothetical protein
MARIFFYFLAFSLFLFFQAGGALAGEAKPWEPFTCGPIVTDAAYPADKGQFVFQVTPSYFIKEGDFDGGGNRVYLPSGQRSHAFSTNIKFAYGLVENLEASLEIPYQYNRVTTESRSAETGGLGDGTLGVKYRFMSEVPGTPRPTLSGVFKVKAPSGKYKDLSDAALGTDALGTGTWDFTLGLDLGKRVQPFIFHANLWVTLPTVVHDDSGRRVYGSRLNYNGAMEWCFSDPLALLLELNGQSSLGRWDGNAVTEPYASQINALAGLHYMPREGLAMILGVAYTLWGKDTAFGWTPQFNLVWSF